jgi:bis(5'-nucleosyl)-tetraphosphatase (symmetrical)
MARLVVGDIQGCFDELLAILEQAAFHPGDDELWIVGDVVNRGPRSLEVLRWLYDNRASVVPVLGNHDLHLLAIAFGGHGLRSADNFGELLKARDSEELLHWLRSWPLIHLEPEGRWLMVHAGIPHIWSVKRAVELAAEVQDAISGPDYLDFFKDMYGNRPESWRDDLEGMNRLRAITNYLTRMRLIDAQGRLDLTHTGGVDEAPEGFFPWYTRRHADNEDVNILFGHWASINGETGVARTFALDTGCVWGRQLTGYRIDDGAYFTCPYLG